MSFPALPYLEYATQNYGNPRIDLASSNLPIYDLAKIAINPAHLQSHPAQLTDIFISQLAEKYNLDKKLIALTPGGTGSIFALSASLEMNQTSFACETPYYEPLLQTPLGFGKNVHLIPRKWCPENKRMIINAEMLKAEFHNKAKPYALWITNPHNPSGTVLSNQTIKDMAKVLEAWGSYLVVNEIYLDFISPLGQGTSYSQSDNIIICSSMTKAYGLGQLRLGWVIAPEQIINKVKNINLHAFGLLSAPSLAYGISILNKLEPMRKECLSGILPKKNWLNTYFNKHSFFKWYEPECGIVGLLRIEGIQNDILFAQQLHKETGIIVAPCSYFGLKGFVRISFGLTFEKLQTGIEAFTIFTKNYLNKGLES